MPDPRKPIGVGIVGLSATGGWAAGAHLPALSAVDGIELRALAASSEASAQAAGTAYGVPAYTSVEQLASDENVDLVVVAVKVPQHRELVLPVLKTGVPVLSEWPLAIDLREAEEMERAAGTTRTFVGLQGRSSPTLRWLATKVVAKLPERGHHALPAAPETGVDTLTGEGLAEVLADAEVVVDVTNSRSFEEQAVMDFFTTSTGNLLAAEAAAGVTHHVALSIVGIERLPDNGYFRAKVAQEQLIKQGPIPYSIVRATQFFEFVRGIADTATDGDTVRVAPVLFQPMTADDVAEAVCEAAVEAPLKGTAEVAGPEQFRFDELIADALRAWNDPRTVAPDPHARYFGSEMTERSLVPDEGRARLAKTHFVDWLRGSA